MLDDVRLSVEDWPAMRARALEIARSLLANEPGVPRAECAEGSEFIEWLADNHFTFLGYREYQLERGSADRPARARAPLRPRPAAHRQATARSRRPRS